MPENKVLVTSRSFGSVSNDANQILNGAGCEITNIGSAYDAERFAQILPNMDALIIGAHPLPAELLQTCPNLKIICKHGVGIDNIPIEAARSLGIAVCNTPGTNSEAVADLTFGLMLAAARNIVYSALQAKQGAKGQKAGVDVCGKTLGLLGFGKIAQCVARRALGFGMEILAYDPYLKNLPGEFSSVRLCALDEVLQSCDFLSLHLPLTDETFHMINENTFSMMKPGAMVINCARGGIIDEKDLHAALVSGRIAGAALDVLEEEPVRPDNPLMALDQVVITNHIGMYSFEAINAVSTMCASQVADFLAGREPINRIV